MAYTSTNSIGSIQVHISEHKGYILLQGAYCLRTDEAKGTIYYIQTSTVEMGQQEKHRPGCISPLKEQARETKLLPELVQIPVASFWRF